VIGMEVGMGVGVRRCFSQGICGRIKIKGAFSFVECLGSSRVRVRYSVSIFKLVNNLHAASGSLYSSASFLSLSQSFEASAAND